MALLGNYSVLAKNPGRAFAGSTISDNRSQNNKSGANRCRFTGWASYSLLAATPNGYTHPGAWILPVDPGGISSYTLIRGDGVLTAAGAMGVNGASNMTGTGTLAGTGQLVVSAVATIAGTGTLTGNVVAALQLAATITGTGTMTGLATGPGSLAASMTGAAGTLTLTSYATGTLAAAITPFTELSPESLALAVWSAPANDNATPGTMGEALNVAQIMLRNKTVTDPTAGTITVYDTDGTTVLYTADLYQDAAGITPYAGAGAERRERLT